MTSRPDIRCRGKRDNFEIRFGPTITKNFSKRELRFVLLHELAHLSLEHPVIRRRIFLFSSAIALFPVFLLTKTDFFFVLSLPWKVSIGLMSAWLAVTVSSFVTHFFFRKKFRHQEFEADWLAGHWEKSSNSAFPNLSEDPFSRR